MEPVWGRGIWWNLRDQKDMVCIIIYTFRTPLAQALAQAVSAQGSGSWKPQSG